MSGRSELARGAFTAFGWLPRRLRRWIIRWWAPSYTVGALCVVVEDQRVLLVRHTYRNGWSSPGGLLGRGELPAWAAVRELGEELGIDVDLVEGPVPVVWPRYRRIDFVFLARLGDGVAPDDAAARSPELREVGWFPLGELPELEGATAEAFTRLGLADPGPPAFPA